MKKIYLILMVLLLSTLASAQYSENSQYDFDNFPAQVFTMEVESGDLDVINFRGFNYDIKKFPQGSYVDGDSVALSDITPVYLIISTIEGEELQQDAITLNCTGLGILEKLEIPSIFSIFQLNPVQSATTYYSAEANAYYTDLLFSMDMGDNDQYLHSSINPTYIDWSAVCSIKSNQDLQLTFMVLQDNSPYEVELYSIPNTALEELAGNVSNTFDSAYSLFEIFIMFGAVMLFVFIPIYAWKLIEYIYRSIKKIR